MCKTNILFFSNKIYQKLYQVAQEIMEYTEVSDSVMFDF